MRIQNYKKIRGPIEKLTIQLYENNYQLEVIKIDNYENVFVSINSTIKPRTLHTIIKNTREAIKEYKIDDIGLKTVILSNKDGFYSYGLYNAINNTVYYNEIIHNVEVLNNEGIELGHIERHEMYHYRQAVNYKIKYGSITENNYSHYIEYTKMVAKKLVDIKGVKKDNVSSISAYADLSYRLLRYDEVEAEIHAKKGAKHV